jgi:hypothetical protein
MQKGILFQCLSSSDPATYVAQVIGNIGPDIDLRILEQAWRTVAERHDIFKVSVTWEGLTEPVQTLHRRAELPIKIYDWRNFSSHDTESALREAQFDERRRGFDFGSPLFAV